MSFEWNFNIYIYEKNRWQKSTNKLKTDTSAIDHIIIWNFGTDIEILLRSSQSWENNLKMFWNMIK